MSEFKDKLLQLTKLRYETLPLLMQQIQIDENTNISDAVSSILKCHLLSEVLLDKLLILALEPNGEAVFSVRLTYNQKLNIASNSILTQDYSLLPESIVSSLRKLNKIRNRLSHELGAIVTREEVISLFDGDELPITFDPETEDIPLIIYHYTAFIFGGMLPKYEEL